MNDTNSDMGEMVVPLNKAKTAGVALCALVFVLLGVVIIASSSGHDAATTLFYIAIGLVSIVFFGMALFYAVGRLFNPTPAIEINARGITDNATAMGVGFVAWDEIASVHIGTTAGKRFLCLVPKDVPGFLARQPAWKRGVMRTNVSMVGAPITIAGTLMSTSLDELSSRVATYLRQGNPEPIRH